MPDVLGNAEREGAAIVEFGEWRAKLTAWIIATFGVAAVPFAIGGFIVVQSLQFRYFDGVASMWMNVAVGCVAPMLAFLRGGAAFATLVVRRRAPAQTARLAARYDVAETELARIVAMAQL